MVETETNPQLARHGAEEALVNSLPKPEAYHLHRLLVPYAVLRDRMAEHTELSGEAAHARLLYEFNSTKWFVLAGTARHLTFLRLDFVERVFFDSTYNVIVPIESTLWLPIGAPLSDPWQSYSYVQGERPRMPQSLDAAEKAATESTVRHPKPPGPKPKHFWPSILGSAAGRLAANGRPETQAELEVWIASRILAIGKHADDSTIRLYASQMLEAFDREMGNGG
jgi:hypothetical protein